MSAGLTPVLEGALCLQVELQLQMTLSTIPRDGIGTIKLCT